MSGIWRTDWGLAERDPSHRHTSSRLAVALAAAFLAALVRFAALGLARRSFSASRFSISRSSSFGTCKCLAMTGSRYTQLR